MKQNVWSYKEYIVRDKGKINCKTDLLCTSILHFEILFCLITSFLELIVIYFFFLSLDILLSIFYRFLKNKFLNTEKLLP